MRYFQTIAFIIEILLISGNSAILLMLAFNIIQDENSWLNSPKTYLRVIDIIGRLFIVLLAGYLIIYSIIPRLIDIPRLVTGNFAYIEGFAININGGSGTLFDYVYIEGTQLKFFAATGIEKGEYRVAYLPHSHRGIFIESMNKTLSTKERIVKIPKMILLFTFYIVIVVGLLNRFAYWIFGFANIVFYSIGLYYYYVYYARTMGTWFSTDNEGLVHILFGLLFLLMFVFSCVFEDFIYKMKLKRKPYNYCEFYEKNFSRYTAHAVIIFYFMLILDLIGINL